MSTTIRIPDVCERDIDLLLLEEFVASKDFRTWFLSQIGIIEDVKLLEASRSVKTSNGESDLEITLEGGLGAIKILIENKVDAPFQPDQAQRYIERASSYQTTGKYKEVITVVMAPEVYFGDETENFGFEAKVTYESTLTWFACTERMNERTAYKLELLRGAIERGRQGWKLIPHKNVTELWHAYSHLAEQIAPQLAMPVPKKEIPATSSFIKFRPAALPANVKLFHKIEHGYVDLQFSGRGKNLPEMERLYRTHLLPNMRIEKAAQSAVIRVRIDKVAITTATFDSCEAVFRKGIETAVTLLEWYQKANKVNIG